MNKRLGILVIICVLAGLGYIYGYRSVSPRPNIFLIVLDTLRTDHLGPYGYERANTPVLDKFAKESLWFKAAITPAPWTPSAMASIFTGLYPTAHGMMPPNNRKIAVQDLRRLDDRLLTMAEIFKAAGYRTLGINTNPWLKQEFGFNQGFDRYLYLDRARADRVNQAAFRELAKFKDESGPHFTYLHYLDPHNPYDPPQSYRSLYTGGLGRFNYSDRVLRRINLYDGEIKYLDDQLGQLFEFLRAQDLYRNSIIVIVADHGEQFREHGHSGHGYKLHSEEIHVPLFIKADRQPKEFDFTVSSLDILPTILELIGLESQPNLHGVSLVGQQAASRLGVLSEIFRDYNLKAFTDLFGKKEIFSYDQALGLVPAKGSSRAVVGVFDTRADPLEQQAIVNPELSARLESQFNQAYDQVLANQVQVEPGSVSDATVEQLKSLGYLK